MKYTLHIVFLSTQAEVPSTAQQPPRETDSTVLVYVSISHKCRTLECWTVPCAKLGVLIVDNEGSSLHDHSYVCKAVRGILDWPQIGQ